MPTRKTDPGHTPRPPVVDPPATGPHLTAHPLARDTVLSLDEPDYLYGRGTLALRVQRAGADPRALRLMEWVRVVGHEIRWDGSEIPRDVMVRVAAISKSLRPTSWLPPRYP